MLSARKGGDEEIVESCMKMQEVINCAKKMMTQEFLALASF